MNKIHPVRCIGIVGTLIIGFFAFTPIAFPQERVWKQFYDQSWLDYGKTMDCIGDLTGDGISEVIVGAPDDPTNGSYAGMIAVHSGVDGSAVLQIYGTSPELFGVAVSRAGDVDSDTIPDFAVGSFDPGGGLKGRGRVTVYSGASASVIWQVTGVIGDFLGCSIADAGDLNGDGIDDLIVGARFGNFARVLSGTDGSKLLGITSPSPNRADFGWTVAAGGDVDGDGIPDVMVSDPYNCDIGYCTGAAYVFSGASGQALHTVYGRGDGDKMGYGMSILGDLNGDGFADYGAGAPLDSSSSWATPYGGYAVIGSGKDGSVLYMYEPDALNSDSWQIGTSLGPMGDVNRDGFDDFMIGAVGAGDYYGSGNVFLYSGRDGGLLYRYEEYDSILHSDEFGWVVANTGDVDGDGHADLAVTAPFESSPTTSRCGSVAVWTGDDLFVNSHPRFVEPFDTVTLTVGQGVALQPYVLFLVDVNGTPTFNLLSFSAFDATGRGSVSGPYYSPGLGPITISVRAFALDASNKLIDSRPEILYLQ